jgi:formate dehydrogenase
MATVLCVLYDDPVDGYPSSYARDDIPTIERYHDGQTTPTPESIDFMPGELLGSVSGELGLRKFSRSAATGSSSPPTRTGRTRSSSASCLRRRS